MDFRTLIQTQPEILEDRYALTFSKQVLPHRIAGAFSHFGVVMLKNALPPSTLMAGAEAFRLYLQSQPSDQSSFEGEHAPGRGENDSGSWHSPWMVRHGNQLPAASVLAAIIRSWAWDVIEQICQSSNIVVLLKFCTARHSIDRSLGVGGHQDAKVVASDVPLSMWIPLQDIVPGHHSGLGFVVPHPDRVLPTLPHNDIGAECVLRDLRSLWIPRYALGDLTIHSRLSPHFTTGFGTLSDRFSLEVRAMARAAASPEHIDPAIYVSRRSGMPTIVDVKSSAGIGADEFLDSSQLAPVTAKQLRRGFA